MGLSANANILGLYSDLAEFTKNRSGLLSKENQNDTNISNANSELKNLFAEIDKEKAAVTDADNNIARIESDNPLDRLYCGIKEFVVTEAGMCGMGMGMGQFEVNNNIKLTGKELLAMSQVLNNNANGQFSPQDLVDQLNCMGIENASLSDNGQSIELTRVDANGNETKVKFCDANGDGMLNGCDYDFSDALCKFNQDLEAYNQELQKAKDEKAQRVNELEQTTAEAEDKEHEIDGYEANGRVIAQDIDDTDKDIKDTKYEIKKAETKLEKQKKAEKEQQDAKANDKDNDKYNDNELRLVA